jgi:acyl-coenzyme A thioesterase PaaI-like protein
MNPIADAGRFTTPFAGSIAHPDVSDESLRARLTRLYLNCHPTYRSTGGWVTHLASDWSRLRVKLPLTWRTRNVHGTLFGGSMYAAVDPLYALMLGRRLGEGYEVWDDEAGIDFRKPGRETLYAECRVSDEEVATIRDALAEEGDATTREYTIDLVDADGTVHATVEKTLFVRRRA